MREETRYFITSLTDVNRFADAVRKHWPIENQLYWQLDVTFGEDRARNRKENAPLNWNIMGKAALPLLRNAELGKKQGIKRKMFMAALDVLVLEKIIQKHTCAFYCWYSAPNLSTNQRPYPPPKRKFILL